MPRSSFTESEEPRQALSSALRRARSEANLTQARMARHLGVSATFYGRMERGCALPSVARLAHIARVLRVSVDVLIGTDGGARPPEAGPPADPSD